MLSSKLISSFHHVDPKLPFLLIFISQYIRLMKYFVKEKKIAVLKINISNHFFLLLVLESHLNPSWRPSPVKAQVP